MCSIGEDDFGDDGGIHAMIPDAEQTKSIYLTENTLCNKCKKPGAIYKLTFRHAECRECFLLYTRHKFRAALGSSKVLPKDSKVILVFDGSGDSIVLLDMLHHAQTQNTFKRLHCTVIVLYIDNFQLLYQCSAVDEKYNRHLDELKIFLQKYSSFESFFVPLVKVEEVIDCITNIKSIKDQQYQLRHEEEKQSLLNSIYSIKCLTSRQEFVKYHRSKLVAIAANYFQSKYAFVCDISSDLASDLLAAVALGRGGSAALDVALVDDRLNCDVKLLRPLKDLTTTEIELYLRAQNLRALQTKRFGMEAGSSASIQNLTKSFVDNLQHNYSATVSTVFRTGDKITVNRDVHTGLAKLNLNDADNSTSQDKWCIFCKSPKDYQVSTTLLAIEYSRLASENGCSLDKSLNLHVKAEENVRQSIEKTYLNKLCHACRNICKDSPNVNILL